MKSWRKGIRIIVALFIFTSLIILSGCLSKGGKTDVQEELYIKINHDEIVSTSMTNIQIESNAKEIVLKLNGEEIKTSEGITSYNLNLKEGKNEIEVIGQKDVNGQIQETQKNVYVVYVKEGVNYNEIFGENEPVKSGEFIFPKDGVILNELKLAGEVMSELNLKKTVSTPTPGTIQKSMYLNNIKASITAAAMTVGEEVELFIFVNNKVVDYINNSVTVVSSAGVRKVQYKTLSTDDDGFITVSNTKYVMAQGLNTIKIIAKQKTGLLSYQILSEVTIDTYSPYLVLNYPKANGNWIIPESDEVLGDYLNTRFDLEMTDVTDTRIFAYVTTDGTIANINSIGNELLKSDDTNIEGKSVKLSTTSRVKVKYDNTKKPAIGDVGYLYIAAVDKSDDNNDYADATGHINFKKIMFKRTESVEIGIVRIDSKEYKEGSILEITQGEFNIFVANNDEGATATIETRLQDGSLLKQVNLTAVTGGFEEKSVNVRNKLGLTSLENLDTISIILRVKINSLSLEENMVIRLQYIDKEQSIDLDTDKITFEYENEQGKRLGVTGNKIYFDKTTTGAPILTSMTIENPSQLNYLLKIDSYFYAVTGSAMGTFYFTGKTTEDTTGTAIRLDKDSPKKEVDLYLGNEKIRTYELIYLVPENADIEFREVTINPVDAKIKIKGKVNMPISILEEYQLKVQLDNVKYNLNSDDITFPDSSTVNFESEFPYNGETQVKILLENTYKPSNTDYRPIHNRKIKILGIDDNTDKLLIVDNEQFIKIENINDFNNISSGALYMYLDDDLVSYDFLNGQIVNLANRSYIKIVLNRDNTPNDTIDEPSTYIERTLYIMQPNKDDVPEWLVVPKNNKAYTAEPENGGGTFVVSGRVKNADEIRLGVRLLNTETNEYVDQIWNENVPQRTTDGYYINIFLDPVTGNFVSPDLKTVSYLRNTSGGPQPMIEDGKDYEVILIAVNNAKGISSRVSFTCYYDQTPPVVNAVGNWKTLYIDKNGVLRNDTIDNDSIANGGIVGAFVKNDTSGEFSIGTVNEQEIRFNIDPTKTESVILIKNQKGFNDYLVGYVKAPADEHVTVVIRGSKGSIREYFITKGTDKKLYENLGDNLYEEITVYFQDIHGIKTDTSGSTLYNNKYVDFDESKINAEIVESAEPKYPLTRIYVNAMPDLNTTSLLLRFSKGGEVIKEQTVVDLKTTPHTFIISSDIDSGDDVHLEAMDKYSNDVFRNSGEKSMLIPVVDKLAPLLPTMDKLTIIDKPVGIQDVISGTVESYESGGRVKLIINDEEKAQAIISPNGSFTLYCDTNIKQTNKSILLAMEDIFGNKTENSNYENRRYVELTNRFAFNYNGKVKDIASSKDGSGSLYGYGEAITITWDINDDGRTDTDDDATYKNRVSKYMITFENSSNGEVLLKDYATTKSYTIAKAENLMGIIDKKEITVKVIPISDLGLEGSSLNNTIKNIFVDTKAPNINMIDPAKIKINVASNQITFDSGIINDNLNTEDYLDIRIKGNGIDQYIRYKDDTISNPAARIATTVISLPNDIKNDDVFTISLVDGAGNESSYVGSIMSYDDEAPSINGLTVRTSTIDNVNRLIIVEVSYEGENEITVVAYRNSDDNEVGTAILSEQNVIYPLFIDGTETDGVYLKVRDKSRGIYGGGNYSPGSKDLTNTIIN